VKMQKVHHITLDKLCGYRQVHPPKDDVLVEYLAQSFTEPGWSGPPIVVRLDDESDDTKGLLDSGVHRLAALLRIRDDVTLAPLSVPARLREMIDNIPVVYPRHLHLHISSSYDGRDWIDKNLAPYVVTPRADLYATNAMALDTLARKIPGVMVSCRSSTNGAIATVMTYSCKYRSTDKTLKTCLAGQHDVDRMRPRIKRFGISDDQIMYRPGSIRDVVKNLGVNHVSLLYLETATYRQTVDALGALYPKVFRGAFVYVANWGRPGVAEAVESYLGGLPDADVWPGQRGPLFWQKGVPGGAFWTGEKDTLRLYMSEDDLIGHVLQSKEIVA